jgi:hypothetical protein
VSSCGCQYEHEDSCHHPFVRHCLAHRGPDRLGPTWAVYERVRTVVPPLDADRSMADDICTVLDLIRRGRLTRRTRAGLMGRPDGLIARRCAV